MLIIEGCLLLVLPSLPQPVRPSVRCPPSPYVDLNNDKNDLSASYCGQGLDNGS